MINNFNGTDIFGATLLNNFITKLNQEFGLYMKIGGTEYTALVNSINTKNSSQDTEIGNIKSAVTTLATRVSTAEGKVSSLETNFANLNASHSSLSTTVDGLSTALGNVQTSISSINNEITNAKTRLTNLETNVTSLNRNLGDVSGLIDSKILTASSELDTKIQLVDESKSDVTHTHTWAEISSKPTTLAGYGITDALCSIGGTINGDLSVTGNGTFGGSLAVIGDVTFDLSDTRLKTEFEPIETALEKIKKLDVGTYYYNDLAREFGFTKTDRQVGLKAQQVQSVLPEAVALAPFDRGIDGLSKSGEEYLTVRYEKLVPLLVAAVKEQSAEIEKLKAELEVVKHG